MPDSDIVLHYHPFSRASNVLWMLEELELPYTLHFADILGGSHKSDAALSQNPMGKVPMLTDGKTIVTESAAIGLYLADRYSHGGLAPTVDDPRRAPYLRWSVFAPSVIEPAAYAHLAKWEYKPASAGWGTYESMLSTIEHAIGDGPWLLGQDFTMADIIFGGTVRFMLQFKMVEARHAFVSYAERLQARPGAVRADKRNAAEVEAHGLGG